MQKIAHTADGICSLYDLSSYLICLIALEGEQTRNTIPKVTKAMVTCWRHKTKFKLDKFVNLDKM